MWREETVHPPRLSNQHSTARRSRGAPPVGPALGHAYCHQGNTQLTYPTRPGYRSPSRPTQIPVKVLVACVSYWLGSPLYSYEYIAPAITVFALLLLDFEVINLVAAGLATHASLETVSSPSFYVCCHCYPYDKCLLPAIIASSEVIHSIEPDQNVQ